MLAKGSASPTSFATGVTEVAVGEVGKAGMFTVKAAFDGDAALGPVSDKVLTETLRRLERHGLINTRTVANFPIEVDNA